MLKKTDLLLEEIAKIGIAKKYQSHHVLVQTGEKVNKLYLVKQGGLVMLHIHPRTGVERAINFFIPEFHPLASIAEPFYLGTPSNYQLKTFTTTKLIEVKKANFDSFLRSSEYREQMTDYGIRSLLQKNDIRAKLISYTSEEMLLYLHDSLPQIIQHIPSKYVANFLGITPQWLSKLKRKL